MITQNLLNKEYMDLIETVKTVKHIRARFEVTELRTMRNALQVYIKYADQVGEYDGYNAECVMRKLEELFHDDEVNILYNNTKESIKDKIKLKKMVNVKDWEELVATCPSNDESKKETA